MEPYPPPISQHPKPIADTCIPVLPNGRYSISSLSSFAGFPLVIKVFVENIIRPEVTDFEVDLLFSAIDLIVQIEINIPIAKTKWAGRGIVRPMCRGQFVDLDETPDQLVA